MFELLRPLVLLDAEGTHSWRDRIRACIAVGIAACEIEKKKEGKVGCARMALIGQWYFCIPRDCPEVVPGVYVIEGGPGFGYKEFTCSEFIKGMMTSPMA